MVIYQTNEWKGHGKQNYYWNEYRLEGNTVYKYKCHRQKFFDGDENNWETDESLEDKFLRSLCIDILCQADTTRHGTEYQ